MRIGIIVHWNKFTTFELLIYCSCSIVTPNGGVAAERGRRRMLRGDESNALFIATHFPTTAAAPAADDEGRARSSDRGGCANGSGTYGGSGTFIVLEV